MSKRVGGAVAARRKAIGLTAQRLADRCKELGVPIHRTTITKIENGRPRFDLGELLVLAAALDVPPALLLFPGYPDEEIKQLLPGLDASSRAAVDWLAGQALLPAEIGDDGTIHIRRGNPGVEIGILVRYRSDLEDKFPLLWVDPERPGLDDGTRDAIRRYRREWLELKQKIEEYRAQLWGTSEGGADA
ncbi:helix-turn-helix domain-containing protein [Mycolicibacterium austroafricanum]|nr:helix-turn-helix domain-containing protein [Mycolicibacterium austroafricanum]